MERRLTSTYISCRSRVLHPMGLCVSFYHPMEESLSVHTSHRSLFFGSLGWFMIKFH